MSGESALPDRIGEHYFVERELGRGGMSMVYLCRDERTGDRVAVKILREEIGSKVAIDRFLREISYSSELDHPRIPKVLGSGVIGGLPYYVMTYVSGESLRSRLDRAKQLPIDEAIDIACGIMEPTSYAHARGIVHRDIKPENVLISEDGIYVLDFGIARAIVESGVDRLTSTGVGVGTPAYMSPEQATGDREVDARSDVYSIGCVLYEMIAGIPPFVGPTAQVIISRRFAAPPARLTEFRDSVPAFVDAATSRALARSPADRWPSTDAFAKALRNPSVNGTTGGTSHASSSRRKTIIGVAGIAAIAVIAFAVNFGLNRSASASGTSGLGRVVVAPLENRTGDRSLDMVGVMASDWVTEGLQQTGLVQVVPTAAALQAARYVASQPAATNRDPNKALAAETGAGTVIGGSYYKQGDRLLFRLDVTDQGGTRLVRTITDVVAPVSEPNRGVKELSNRLRGWLALRYDERLQGGAPEADQPPTYEAYQTFSEGMTKYIAVDNANALPLFLRSYELDTSFTVGLLYASIAATNIGQFARADSMLRKVNQRRQTLSEYNRAWLDFRLAFVHGDHEAALAAIRIAANLAPESKAAYNRALKAYEAGYYREALNAIERLPPDRGPMRGFSGYWGVYTSILHALGLYQRELEVGATAQKIFSYKLTTFTPIVRALIALEKGDSVATVVRAAQGIPTDPIGWDYGHLLNEVAQEWNAHGQPDSARVYFDELRAWLVSADRGPTTQSRLIYTLYALNRFREAQHLVVGAHQRNPANPEYLGLLALTTLRLADRAGAKLLTDSLAITTRPYTFGVGHMYLARIAAADGRKDAAVAGIRAAFADGFPHNLDLHRDPDFISLRTYNPFRLLLRSKD